MRAIVPTLTLVALALAAGGCGSPSENPASLAASAQDPGITHGPLLGRIGANSVAVWARTAKPGRFQVFYGKSPTTMNQSITVDTRLEDDNTGWGTLDTLDSNTKYYYSVSSRPAPSEAERLRGHFHTLPEPSDVYDPVLNPRGLFNLRFEFACGNNQNTGSGSAYDWDLPTYKTLRRELVRDEGKNRVDFSILNGDWLYEEEREYALDAWKEQVGLGGQLPYIVKTMPSIVGVWQNYKLYLERGTPLADYHRYVPHFFTFDDHEIINDVYGSGEIGRRDRRAVFRDVGLSGWYDYLGWANDMPPTQDILYGLGTVEAGSDILTAPVARFDNLELDQAGSLHILWGTPDAGVMTGPDDTTGGDPNAGVYEIVEVLNDDQLRIRPAARETGEVAFSIGRRSYWRKRFSNIELYFLDTRTYREMHDVNDRRADKSMLGDVQKDWLLHTMHTSQADASFVISSVNLMIPHVGGTGAGGGPANKDDAWTAFLREREELIEFWDSLDQPVFVLTGDLHNSFAIQITDNVWELASGPHNSVNHPVSSEAGRPINGPYDSFGREAQIHWSSYVTDETPEELRNRVIYAVVQVNNVFRNDRMGPKPQWIAYTRPQVVFQYYDGVTGELLYAHSVQLRPSATRPDNSL